MDDVDRAYGEPGVVALLTAGNLKAPGPDSSPARAFWGLDKPPGPSCTLDKPTTCRAVHSFEQLC